MHTMVRNGSMLYLWPPLKPKKIIKDFRVDGPKFHVSTSTSTQIRKLINKTKKLSILMEESEVGTLSLPCCRTYSNNMF